MRLAGPIEYLDDYSDTFGPLNPGVLLITESDPRRATLLEHTGDRPEPYDLLDDVKVSDKGDHFIVSGISALVVSEIGLFEEQARVTLRVEPIAGCQGCR